MYKLLKYLSPEELSKFEKFINSPYFNNRPKLIKLYDVLRVSDENNPGKKEIFSSLYPGEKYNDARIRKLFSDFNKLYDLFLGYIGIEKWDNESIGTNMLEMMQEKGMSDEFSDGYRQLSKKMSSPYFKEDPYYRSLSRIELLKYYSEYDKLKKPSPAGLERAAFNMDLQFVYLKLNMIRDILLHNMLNNEKYSHKIEFYDKVLNYVKDNLKLIIKEHPNLYIIYLSVMSAADESNPVYISDLAAFIKRNEKKIDKNRLGFYYTYITSYYWNRINKGDISYRPKLMDAYKQMERKGIIKSEKYILHSIFNSIVIAAVWAKDMKWLENFVEKHKEDIEPEYFHDVYNLSLAKIQFYKGKYELCLKHLNNVEYKSPTYYINAKTILLKTLYEMGNYDGMKYTMDSLKHYIYRNNALVSQQVHNIKMVIKYFKYLVKLKGKDYTALQKFLEMLERERTFVPEKNWLAEKISELSNIDEA